MARADGGGRGSRPAECRRRRRRYSAGSLSRSCQSNVSPRSYDLYRYFLHSFTEVIGGELTLGALKPFHVIDWLNAQAGWSNSTKNGAAQTIRTAFLKLRRIVFPPSQAKGKRHPRVIYLDDDAWNIVEQRCKRWASGPIFRNRCGTAPEFDPLPRSSPSRARATGCGTSPAARRLRRSRLPKIQTPPFRPPALRRATSGKGLSPSRSSLALRSDPSDYPSIPSPGCPFCPRLAALNLPDDIQALDRPLFANRQFEQVTSKRRLLYAGQNPCIPHLEAGRMQPVIIFRGQFRDGSPRRREEIRVRVELFSQPLNPARAELTVPFRVQRLDAFAHHPKPRHVLVHARREEPAEFALLRMRASLAFAVVME